MRKIFAILIFPLLLIFFFILKLFFWDVPGLAFTNPDITALMTWRGGTVDKLWVDLDDISPALARAVVASEDSRFYEHNGVDWKEIKNAFERNNKKGSFAFGGSTITMQLAKNLFLSPHKNVIRKAVEIPLALKMDADLSKTRILEIYLNVVEFGNGIYGAEAASKYYFKKNAASLTSYEAAFLAAILPNPLEWGKNPPGPYIRKRIATIQARMNSVPEPYQSLQQSRK